MASTGISGAADQYGRVLGALSLGEAGYLDIALPLPVADSSPYARLHTVEFFAFLILVLAAGWLRYRYPRN